MSETDSDLDFQSADEDTESDISNQPPSEIVENASDVVNSAQKITEISSSNSNVSESANNKLNSSQNEKQDDIEQCKNNKENPSCDTLSNEDDTGIKEIESGSPNTSSIVESSKQEKHRVPLRLEKKIQQKAKLPSVEKCDINKEESGVSESVNQNVVDSKKEESHSWGFSSWGTNLLSTAASSVSTFSSQVSQGIGTVLETVESSLGAPSPEELASALKEKQGEKADVPSEETNEDASSSGILSDMTSWTQVFGNTGSKVIMGGLDTLELIGKKTMDILTEGDPGLRKKRTIFSNGTSLSEILREAKEQADALGEHTSEEGGIIHYSQAFDDYQGLVHLEALEMLSKQAQVKFQRLLMRHSKDTDIKKRLEDIKLIFEDLLNYDEPSGNRQYPEFGSKFRENALKLNIPLNVDNIIMTEERLKNSFSNLEEITDNSSFTPNDIFQSSICTLAEFTAKCIEVFHKIGELILVQSDLGTDLETWASDLINLSDMMCLRVNCFASSYQTSLDSSQKYFPNYTNSNGLNITGMVTNIYVEASNSNKYIQDALQMLLPVLQVRLLES